MFESALPIYARVGIYAHAILGLAALLTGGVAMASPKGSLSHRKAGSIFFWCMLAAIACAIPAVVARRNVFLALLMPFTVYMLLRGWQVSQARLGRQNAKHWMSKSALLLSALASSAMVAVGILRKDAFGANED